MAPVQIEVYLRSITLPSRLAEFKDSYDFHYELEIHFRDTYDWLREQGFSKGRVYEPDSAALLPALEAALARIGGGIVVHDLATLSGKVHGWLVGVRTAPGVRLDGQSYLGLVAAQRALRRVVEYETDDTEPMAP